MLRLVFSICLVILLGGYGRAQSTDSLKLHLNDLLTRWRAKRLTDTDYLKGVDSVAPLLAKADSLREWLSTYRRLAFSDSGRGKSRAQYYTYLAINAYNLNQFGRAVYYSEKNNEERTKLGLFEKGGFSHGDLFALTVLANNHDYRRVFARYAALKPALFELPSAIPRGNASPEQVFVAMSILQSVNFAACRSGDTTRAREIIGLADSVMEGVAGFPAKYKDYRLLYDYILHNDQYEHYRLQGQWEAARNSLLAAIRDVNTSGFRPNLQPSYREAIYSEAVDLYFNLKKSDSANYYLSQLTAGDGNVRYSSLDPTIVPDARSRLLAEEGRYAEAYKELRKLYGLRDSAYYTVSADKDNNLYALAEAENARYELVRLDEQKRAADRSALLLFFLTALLVVGGVAVFFVVRSMQQRRLLDLRLQLARNFHDQIGPMLLYGSVLAKKRGDEEMREHISLIMDAVRDISHDLKSSELSTVGSFGKEVSGLLEKVKAATEIGYSLQVSNASQILAYGQLTHVQAIVQELISNSIKHAECRKITVRLGVERRKLILSYSDDGEGINPSLVGGGIGMKNIEERVRSVNGSWQLNNAWPKGYSVDITFPLV